MAPMPGPVRSWALGTVWDRRDTARVIRGGNATIFVTDMDRAVSFYTETLGLQLTFRAGDHWASIDAGDGLHLGLHPASPRSAAPGTEGAITVGFAVDEPIEDVVASLQQLGVTFRGPVDDEGQLKLAYFTDPDRNQLYLAQAHRE
jgi:catechol 2,3-dioxygenase-like lactoylglutathione lyase family enzyme